MDNSIHLALHIYFNS